MTCSHTRETSRWVPESHYHDDGSSTHTSRLEYETIQTLEDIDLHRYHCTQCGQVMYYSERAKLYFEDGIKSEWIQGLK